MQFCLKSAALAAAASSLLCVCTVPHATAGTAETIIANFIGSNGSDPEAGLVADADGNLYGTTQVGGSAGYGTVFELTPPVPGSRAAWKMKVLHNFTQGNDGGNPFSEVLIDGSGNVYGTTAVGGKSGGGVVFKLTAPKYAETVIYNFGSDGYEPFGDLTFDDSGAIYGTAAAGGSGDESGVVFQLTPPAPAPGKKGAWKYHVIHAFSKSGDGAGPFGGILFDRDSGDLFGTTLSGGKDQSGTVFRLTPQGSGWDEKLLHSFTGLADGSTPSGRLAIDSSGNLYGTTTVGGNGGAGTAYELIRPASGNPPWKVHVIHAFSGGDDGQFPIAGLTMDATGNLYGTTVGGGKAPTPPQSCFYGGDGLAGNLNGEEVTNCGTVFELQKSGGKWKFLSLYSFQGWSFDGIQDGEGPDATVMLDQSGNIYGTTTGGGPSLVGTVFKITR
jgi:uncharacterized repeat protein (TIGR03803 family)